MDFLQFALIFLIVLLGVFLTITGLQVFFILRDLKKALNKLNEILFESGETVEKVRESIKKNNPRRFFRR